MAIRGNLAKTFAGGPPFRVEPNRLIVEPVHNNRISSLASKTSDQVEEALDKLPVPTDVLNNVGNRLRDFGFSVKELGNTGLLVAEAEDLGQVIDSIAESANTFSTSAVQELKSLKEKATQAAEDFRTSDIVGGDINFSSDSRVAQEAGLRERLGSLSLRNTLTSVLEDIEEISNVQMAYTRNTFGPRNLNIDITDPFRTTEEDGEMSTLGDAVEKIGAKNVWRTTRGENAIIATLDTSFNAEWLDTPRTIDTFSGPDVDSAFSAPEEGHGTMTAYSAAGNKEESGLKSSGVAPDAGMLLARTTGADGALSRTEEALDWLVGKVKEADRPVFSNHSYGVPLCSAKPMSLCDKTTTNLVKAINKRDDHQSFYAAGNESLYCGHRLGGITNGINGPNSLPNSISVGALRYDLRDAQNYSSHGFGTCANVSNNPKPDVSCLIPSAIPYGTKVKDMSSGVGGSSGGTSDACPLTCGVGALVGSVINSAEREAISDALEQTAMLPRITQVNLLRDHDARFGHGQVQADAAVDYVM